MNALNFSRESTRRGGHAGGNAHRTRRVELVRNVAEGRKVPELVSLEAWQKFCLPGTTPDRLREYARTHFAPPPGERKQVPARPGSAAGRRNNTLWPQETVDEAHRLRDTEGVMLKDISKRLGVPRSTLKSWFYEDARKS